MVEVASCTSPDREASTEFYGGILLAGFVNAHCHLELSYLRGAITPHQGFAAFASSIGKVRGLYSDDERLKAIERADAELRREGVVAVGDIVNGDSSFATKSRSGIEYRSFAEVFGLNTNSTKGAEPLTKYPNTTLTPHSTYSLNDAIFREIVTKDEESTLSIHFMESESEAVLYRGEGELYEWYQASGMRYDFAHYLSPAERLVASIPASRKVLLIHNCCVTQRDINIIKAHFGDNVYWVLCPRSNDYISRIAPPTELLRSNGLNICIGTDSLASNESLSIIKELSLLSGVPLNERLDWATRIGARALGLDEELGDIAVGKRPSINLLSGIDYTTMELTQKSQLQRII